MSELVSKAEKEGYDAAMSGKPIWQNPNSSFGDQYKTFFLWNQGWKKGNSDRFKADVAR